MRRLLALATLLVAALAPGAAAALTLQGTVTSVVDGDTIKVKAKGFETTVRLLGIDTPETKHPSKPVQCFGPAASSRMRALLPPGQRVRLVTDDSQDTRDRYGRLLAYVYKAGKSSSVNLALVQAGYAKVYIYGGNPFIHADAYRRAESRARSGKRGLWGPPCNGNTTKPDPSTVKPPPPPSAPPSPPPAGGNCDPNYTGACVPPYPPDVDCADINGPVQVVGSDPHRLDGDGDGIACE